MPVNCAWYCTKICDLEFLQEWPGDVGDGTEVGRYLREKRSNLRKFKKDGLESRSARKAMTTVLAKDNTETYKDNTERSHIALTQLLQWLQLMSL